MTEIDAVSTLSALTARVGHLAAHCRLLTEACEAGKWDVIDATLQGLQGRVERLAESVQQEAFTRARRASQSPTRPVLVASQVRREKHGRLLVQPRSNVSQALACVVRELEARAPLTLDELHQVTLQAGHRIAFRSFRDRIREAVDAGKVLCVRPGVYAMPLRQGMAS